MDSPVGGDSSSPSPESKPAAGKASPDTALQRLGDLIVHHVRGWGITLILVGLSAGLAIWPLLHHDQLDYILVGDQLDVEQRMEIVKYMAASLAGVMAMYLGAFLMLRRRVPRLTLYDAFVRLNRYTFVIACLPFLTALMQRGIEREHQFVTLLFITIITICFGVLIYRLYETRPEPPPGDEKLRWPWLPPIVVVGLFLFYSLYVSHLALLDHRNLGTHVFDLGIYDNIFWHNANGDFMGCSYCKTGKHMSSHFDPILWVLSFIYRLNPRAETLLVLQSVWLGTGVFPLYFIGKSRLKNPWAGVLLAGIYVCYPHLHGVNMFDFHSLSLVVPTLMWSIYCIDTGRIKTYWAVLFVMLITREDISLLSCFIGVYAIVKRRTATGLLTIVIALAYLTMVKAFIMNDPGLIMEKSSQSTSFHYFYNEIIPYPEEGMKGLVITVFTNPVFALKVLFKEQKIFFFLLLLVPLLFLPLASGPKRFMMIYGLVFIGTATRKYVYSPHFQYSSILFPILMASMPDAIDRVSRSRVAQVYGLTRRRLMWTLLWTSLVSTLLCTHKYGVFWVNDHFRAGWNTLARGNDEYRMKRFRYVQDLIAEHLPEEASVCVSSSIGSQLSNRPLIKKWPAYYDADFLLVMEGRFKKKSKRRLERLLRRGTFRLVDQEYGVSLYERVPDDERAEARKQYRAAQGDKDKDTAKGRSKDAKGRSSSARSRRSDAKPFIKDAKSTADPSRDDAADADLKTGEEPSDDRGPEEDLDDLDRDAADRGPETDESDSERD